jgi:hypothetical protein
VAQIYCQSCRKGQVLLPQSCTAACINNLVTHAAIKLVMGEMSNSLWTPNISLDCSSSIEPSNVVLQNHMTHAHLANQKLAPDDTYRCVITMTRRIIIRRQVIIIRSCCRNYEETSPSPNEPSIILVGVHIINLP